MAWHRLQPSKMSILWADDQNREQSQLKAGLDASTPKANLGSWIIKKCIYTCMCACVSVSAKAVDTAGWLTACDSSLSVWYQSKLNNFFPYDRQTDSWTFFPISDRCVGEALKKNIFSSLEDLTLKVQDVKIPPAGANRSRAQTLNASLMLIGASNLCQLVPAGICRLIWQNKKIKKQAHK